MRENKKIQKVVRAYYADIAQTDTGCCAPSNRLYPAGLLKGLPDEIASFTAGSGDPVSPADLQPGEVVLDLGSGGGLDCFLAARLVGRTGRVIGLDMTPEMLARARRDAKRLGLGQVSFREGTLEEMPIEDQAVDVVLSNCVINLSSDKAQVFREVYRVLKPGGRLSVSDVVANHALPQDCKLDMTEWCGCSSGALPYREYQRLLASTGFVQVEFTPESDFYEVIEKQESKEGLVTNFVDELQARIEHWESLEEMDFKPFMIHAVKPE